MSTNTTIQNFEPGERLDKVIASSLPQYSRSALSKLIDTNNVEVNGKPQKSRYKVKPKDIITVDTSRLTAKPDEIELPIIYEDQDVIVINKPSGVLTHSKGVFNKEATVATFIQKKLTGDSKWLKTNRAGIVHRLDRATSGLIICAKNKQTEDYLKGQFSKRNVKKTYLAVITNNLPENEGIIDIPIDRNPKKPSTFKPGPNGKSAETYFKVIKTSSKGILVLLKPVTGRTHQLRVHLKYLKCPILGDIVYGGRPAERLMLHSFELELTLPSRERKSFSVEPPKGFLKV